MARKPLTLPYAPLVVLAEDGQLTWDRLSARVSDRIAEGVSICLTNGIGASSRGGYFFHIRQCENGYVFYDFEAVPYLEVVDGVTCVQFINHVSGRAYSQDIWESCQSANLRSDD